MDKTRMNRRGQVGLAEIPNAVLLLGVAAVVGVVFLILLASVRDTVGEDACELVNSDFTYNTTSQQCDNTSVNGTNTFDPISVNASQDAESGIAEVFENFDLIGLMIGLGVVLVILLAVFAFIGGRNSGVF